LKFKQSKTTKCWHREADVVVVGYGAAGASAAITAYDAGVRVLILEKAPQGQEGGNSRVSAQGWFSPDPVDKAIEYFNSLCGDYAVPQEIVRVWAAEMSRNLEWIVSLGVHPTAETSFHEKGEFPELPGAECAHVYRIGTASGHSRTWLVLKEAVEKRGIEVLYSTPGKKLIQENSTLEVIGVQSEQKGAEIDIKASKAVILTCGGFENNLEMVRQYLTDLPYCYPLGTPFNTGDGIKMAISAGADLWHMNNISGPWYGIKLPGFAAALEVLPLHFAREFTGGLILVNGDGKRFVDEKYRDAHGKIKIGGQWLQSRAPHPLFMIFDQTLLTTIPLNDKNSFASWNSMHKVYGWSSDNRTELEKGWIKQADTIGDLAGLINVDTQTLGDSVQRWNRGCLEGKDLDFGRTRMLSPIIGPPFYAIELFPVFLNTQGGPRRNEKGQIIRPDGKPIRRLYSAGELGSVYSFLYQGGGNLGECMAFGRISGRNASAENPWE
jgi:succinate dehydrogenase/fumarate reductase flavoprotein subunit